MSDKSGKVDRRISELIEENLRLAKALQESNELLNKIFHASSNMMAIHSVGDGCFVDVNEAAASLGGYARDELIGRTLKEFELFDDPDPLFDDLDPEGFIAGKLRKEGRIQNVLRKARTKSGEIRTVLASIDPVTINDEPCVLAVSVDITDREKEADAVRRSEEKYRTLVENSLQGLAIIQEQRFVFCNNMFATMWGYSVEELLCFLPGNIESMCHPDERETVHWCLQDQLDDKPVTPRFECRGLKKDGSTIWLEMCTSLMDYNGKPAAQLICMDITERKNAENALRESEEKFRLIAETIDEIFWIYDMEKQAATYISPAFERIWGLQREEIIGRVKPPLDPIHPDDRGVVRDSQRFVEKGQPIDYEYRIVRDDGSIRHIWQRGFPIVDRDGKIRKYIGYGQDVTPFKEAAEALKESREYYHRIVNHISDPIFVKDRQHKYLLVNDAMCSFTGKPREEMLGSSEVSDEIAAHYWEAEEMVFRTGKESVTEDIFTDDKGGEQTFLAKKSILVDNKGNPQIVGVLRDITDYKRLESQFLQSQKMEAIGVLAGGVAHDFNNLLNVINGYAELILEDLEPDSPMRKDIVQIRDAGQRAAMLTSQLLAFGRKQIMQPEVFNLNQVIAGMNSLLRRLIGEDIDTVSNISTEPLMIHADRGKIQQIIMNLVVNARDAMPEGGKLTIETTAVDLEENYILNRPETRPGPYAMFAISDSGMGMNQETQARIFEPFFTTKEKGKGTGLGLSTVYGIVKQSDGYIWVYSEIGRGTTIKIYFPRVTETPEKSQIEKGEQSGSRGFETVLIVEDENAVRSFVSRVLRDRGFNVLEAADGREALHIAQDYPNEIHLVISDVVMPGVGGKALISHLEEVRPRVKSLFISGYTDNAIVHHGILDSGLAFLQKPFSVDSLIGKVREVLGGQ